jgi:hypothetical protein
MTRQDHTEEQSGVRERLGDVVHAVQDAVADRVAPVADRVAPVTERVAPAVDAVSAALHEAGQTATHLIGRQQTEQAAEEVEEGPVPVPSGTRIVRPPKGGGTFLAWRDGQWVPVHREHGAGWMWSA